jgi:Ser/Thr protein kinase RdoA (MazF antagonist)
VTERAATLTEAAARDIMRAAGVPCTPKVTFVKRNNHVYRIEASGGAFYLKTYTKNWYSLAPGETSGCVAHEASAYRILSKHGLAAPRVLRADETCSNPLGRPFLLIEALGGKPLTEVLETAARDDFDAALQAVGRYLAGMHAITFRFPGYLDGDGPTGPPSQEGWQHYIWTIDAFRRMAFETWEANRGTVSVGLLDRAREFYAQAEDSLKAEYEPPRFVHGDCHAHQFFICAENGDWKVAGVVDMEVASAGDYGEDFDKLGIELAGRFPSGNDWWTPLFAGYGRTPPFEPMELRFAALAYDADYLGRHNWPGTKEQRLARIIDARDWKELLTLK